MRLHNLPILVLGFPAKMKYILFSTFVRAASRFHTGRT